MHFSLKDFLSILYEQLINSVLAELQSHHEDIN